MKAQSIFRLVIQLHSAYTNPVLPEMILAQGGFCLTRARWNADGVSVRGGRLSGQSHRCRGCSGV